MSRFFDLFIQKLDENNEWENLMLVPAKWNEPYPDIILLNNQIEELKQIKGQKIRFETIEEYRSEDENGNVACFHWWEIGGWDFSHNRFVALQPKKYVRYYSRELQKDN